MDILCSLKNIISSEDIVAAMDANIALMIMKILLNQNEKSYVKKRKAKFNQAIWQKR